MGERVQSGLHVWRHRRSKTLVHVHRQLAATTVSALVLTTVARQPSDPLLGHRPHATEYAWFNQREAILEAVGLS